MSNCTSGCRTQDHESYGECLRDKNLASHNSTQSVDGEYFKNVKNTAEITEYRAARAQGIQPRSTNLQDIRDAVDGSRKFDTALTVR